MKYRIQILLTFLIIIKLVLGSIFMVQSGLIPLFGSKEAIAAEKEKHAEAGELEKKKDPEKETIDLEFLIKKKAELEKEKEKIDEQKTELLTIQNNITQKIIKLTQLRDEIKLERAKKDLAEEKKFKHLIKVYSAMKPQNAANLIEKLDIKLAIELLSKMKGDNVGKILSFVTIEKAAKISEGLVQRD